MHLNRFQPLSGKMMNSDLHRRFDGCPFAKSKRDPSLLCQAQHAMDADCMQRHRVSSTSVDSIGYEDAPRTLEVAFKSGGVYRYYGVEAQVFAQLMNAPSKGRFVNAYVRTSYPFSRIELRRPQKAAAPRNARNVQPKRRRSPRNRPR